MTDDARSLRVVADLRLEIDRDLCVGFGDCVTESPGSFELDEEGVAVFTDPGSVGRDELLQACAACPVDAITVYENGVAVIP
ncbi:MAG: ferredoxin [Gemmatimonadota bacterium]|nr:ferredoxin [Gemmatimonadota bacterium]